MKLNTQRCIGPTLTVALLVFIGASDGWQVSPTPLSRFAVPPARPAIDGELPVFNEQFIDPTFSQPSAHVSSLCQLTDGRMLALWYAGSREGARDIALYTATREHGLTNIWSPPAVVGKALAAGEETFRYVKKIGNAIPFVSTNGQLHLLYVTTGFGGWSCSALNLKTSSDRGSTWSRSRRLGLSPFFNISELVKNQPTPLVGGGFVVPIYHEVIGKFPELLWLRPDGDGFDAVKTRVAGGRSAFQPSLVALDESHAVMFCRAAGSVAKVHITRTADAGRTWTKLETIDLPNSDSGLDAIRLSDGRLLLAFNDTDSGRDNLRLAVSSDAGATWTRAGTLAAEKGEEFSYPTAFQSGDDLIHVSYTWKRRGIKEATFNIAWLDAQMKGALK